jgi:hypothetical protein
MHGHVLRWCLVYGASRSRQTVCICRTMSVFAALHSDRRGCRSQPETSAPGQCNGSGPLRTVQPPPVAGWATYVGLKHIHRPATAILRTSAAAAAHHACTKFASHKGASEVAPGLGAPRAQQAPCMMFFSRLTHAPIGRGLWQTSPLLGPCGLGMGQSGGL